MTKTLYLALLLAATAHALAADDTTRNTDTDCTPQAKSADSEETQALADLQQRAAAGDATAQFEFGVLYYYGQGVAQDYGQARAWWEKAAAQGHADAQYILGILYDEGRGVVQDYAQARAWYEKAAAQTGDKEIQQAAQKALQDLNKTGGKKP